MEDRMVPFKLVLDEEPSGRAILDVEYSVRMWGDSVPPKQVEFSPRCICPFGARQWRGR
jgi:hypothetical protein